MPLNSVQLYIQGLVDGIAVPGGQDIIKAWITPPVIETLVGPRAYVWGGHVRDGRQSMPRGPGFRELRWEVDVYLAYLTNPQVTDVDQRFPLVIDAVWAALWAAPMGTFITDPTTGQRSQIIAVAEETELDYPPERVPTSLRMLLYLAQMRVTVKEVVQV